jgi:hypothetical protein
MGRGKEQRARGDRRPRRWEMEMEMGTRKGYVTYVAQLGHQDHRVSSRAPGLLDLNGP